MSNTACVTEEKRHYFIFICFFCVYKQQECRAKSASCSLDMYHSMQESGL